MFGLKDKVVLVTGGNRGIGAAIVGKLEKHGAQVAYTYRSDPGANGKLPIRADVTNLAEMDAAVQQVEEELGPIYGVVANAGITNDTLLSRMNPEQWESVISTNLNGAFNSIRPVAPLMYERKEGCFIFISSVVGEQGNIGQVNYSATKAGLIGMAKTLGLEGARYGVRANVVSPGFTETDMVRTIPDKVKEKILKTIPLRRFATEEEIAWGVVYLMSPVTGGYITGATLSINGGRHT
ncbi:MAG: SDR family oxidoreductase [Oceanicoccus sp.]|uniref:SDR family oxidoreductase n=1 Tax=Oceanicoccus sp. TaxID=2691044 RepID=UPI002633035D|nr:SDR family oxidoreductase [Oceanicoccus sp.]MCP3908949.1 SDR family oxidoreductase [Oceanicoccus sp.]